MVTLNWVNTESAPIARFMGPTWATSGADRTQVGPMLAPWTLLSGRSWLVAWQHQSISLAEPMLTPHESVPVTTYEIWGQLHKRFSWIFWPKYQRVLHYNDVIMSAMVSQITSLAILYSSMYSSADQRKHQSSASLAFVRGIHRWPVNSPHKGPSINLWFVWSYLIRYAHDYIINDFSLFGIHRVIF